VRAQQDSRIRVETLIALIDKLSLCVATRMRVRTIQLKLNEAKIRAYEQRPLDNNRYYETNEGKIVERKTEAK
jgi:hypothetical protein